ncbi:MAG: hypothetical protein EZS28_014152 [Streblomastix strix]|uniref:Proteasome activator PA28 C-terminal domain-containing protein n=1 Tax=Streblomastix strix TaxID=222440 RepID=A0A5J4W5W0_9EUKA|nr:MAG: hypothetical protein EZS28_014152 [Streblomastix strix]
MKPVKSSSGQKARTFCQKLKKQTTEQVNECINLMKQKVTTLSELLRDIMTKSKEVDDACIIPSISSIPPGGNVIIPLNQKLIDLITQVTEEARSVLEIYRIVHFWIQLNIPPVEEGRGIGVEIQTEVTGEIESAEETATTALSTLSIYHLKRSQIVEKICRYPSIENFQRVLIFFDRKQHFDLVVQVKALRDECAEVCGQQPPSQFTPGQQPPPQFPPGQQPHPKFSQVQPGQQQPSQILQFPQVQPPQNKQPLPQIPQVQRNSPPPQQPPANQPQPPAQPTIQNRFSNADQNAAQFFANGMSVNLLPQFNGKILRVIGQMVACSRSMREGKLEFVSMLKIHPKGQTGQLPNMKLVLGPGQEGLAQVFVDQYQIPTKEQLISVYSIPYQTPPGTKEPIIFVPIGLGKIEGNINSKAEEITIQDEDAYIIGDYHQEYLAELQRIYDVEQEQDIQRQKEIQDQKTKEYIEEQRRIIDAANQAAQAQKIQEERAQQLYAQQLYAQQLAAQQLAEIERKRKEEQDALEQAGRAAREKALHEQQLQQQQAAREQAERERKQKEEEDQRRQQLNGGGNNPGQNPATNEDMLPCECGEIVPRSRYEAHQAEHIRLREQVARQRQQQGEGGQGGVVNPPVPQPAPDQQPGEEIIPCDRCKKPIPFSQYEAHQQEHNGQRQQAGVGQIQPLPQQLQQNPVPQPAPDQQPGEIIIPCERCRKPIPFSQYQAHFDEHQRVLQGQH